MTMFFIAKAKRHTHRPAMLIIALLAAHTACADEVPIFRVDGGGSGHVATGRTWKSAFTGLQEGIDAAFNAGGGEVWVKAGVYQPSGDGRDSSFELKPGVRLYGGFRGVENECGERNPKANRTILNGDIGAVGDESDNCYHLVTGATDTRIDGFIISRGNANGLKQKGTGGGMTIPAGTRKMTVANCTFEKNNAGWQGGAIYGGSVELTVTNCTFFSNAAANGGGISIKGPALIALENCAFSANTGKTAGGAINLENEIHASMVNCRFLSNSSGGNGGALLMESGGETNATLKITDCQFTDNRSDTTGGAVFIKGAFSSWIEQCSFIRNSGNEGTGGIVVSRGALALIQQCTYKKNRGEKDQRDLFCDDTSQIFDTLEALQASFEPEEEKPVAVPLKMLNDVYVYNPRNTQMKLRLILAAKPCTVLVLGDLTDPDFIENYRNLEAVANDYKPLGAQFFYVYRAPLHPENNGYLQPFSIQERARQAQRATTLLKTKTPWLYDCMDNQTLAALMDDSDGNVFIYSAEGSEHYHGTLDDTRALRNALKKLVGEASTETSPNRFPSPGISPKDVGTPDLLDRIRFDPETEPFSPLLITPVSSRFPFYVKLRAEGDDDLLKTGRGRLYLGFHVDPLYQTQWDNKAEPLEYMIRAPRGVAAPSTDDAPEIKSQQYDSEPREFVLTTRQLDPSKPLNLRVEYTVYSPQQDKSITVTQLYTIHLKRDPFGGKAFRRQILHTDPPRKQQALMPVALRDFDSNGDGKLSRGELSGNLWSKFSKIDTDGDGYLSADEYADYLASR